MARYATFQRLGRMYQFFETPPSRSTTGRVHLRRWSREHKQYVLLCRPNDVGAFSGYYGHELAEPADVTCKACAARDPRQ